MTILARKPSFFRPIESFASGLRPSSPMKPIALCVGLASLVTLALSATAAAAPPSSACLEDAKPEGSPGPDPRGFKHPDYSAQSAWTKQYCSDDTETEDL